MGRTAFAYFRTSSAANVGDDKDTLPRQRAAVEACARHLGYELAGEYYDPDVSGADPIEGRRGFTEMMGAILANGTRTIIVEDPSRFARGLMVQEVGYAWLCSKGIALIAASSPQLFAATDEPMTVAIRQIMGVIAELEKATLVKKLRTARDRKSAKLGHRVEGAKRLGRIPPEHAAMAMELRALGLTYRQLPAALAQRGMVSQAGTPYGVRSLVTMVKRAQGAQ